MILNHYVGTIILNRIKIDQKRKSAKTVSKKFDAKIYSHSRNNECSQKINAKNLHSL